MRLVSSDMKRKIEDETYKGGGDLDNVLTVYSILLRDRILEEHGLEVPEYADE